MGVTTTYGIKKHSLSVISLTNIELVLKSNLKKIKIKNNDSKNELNAIKYLNSDESIKIVLSNDSKMKKIIEQGH